VKNEITLREDEPRLVKLMIDYLYRLDYEDKPEDCNGNDPIEKVLEPAPSTPEVSGSVPKPDSPVAEAIEIFEDLSTTSPGAEDTWDGVHTSKPEKKKIKKHKRTTFSWDSLITPPMDSKTALANNNTLSKPKHTGLTTHAHMYALADKFHICDLKELARNKFAEAASQDWNSSEFPLAVQTVYTSTPENDHQLRSVVVETITRHRELLKREEVERLVKEINGLAFGLLKVTWDKQDDKYDPW
jgi:hypothetical protein